MRPRSIELARLAGGAVLAICLVSPAGAETVLTHEDTKLQLGALLQPQGVFAQDSAPNGDPGTDFFLRRARLMLSGDLTKQISFFIDTEQVNLGKDGNWETSIYIQDAFMSLRVTPEVSPGVYIDAGMIIVPFTRHSMQSAISLNGIDYHSSLIRYPVASTRVWRDMGAQVRANIDRFSFRAGVFNGVVGTNADPATNVMAKNPGDVPRVAGNARVNILGEDATTFFYPGIQFADVTVISAGVGVDWQHGAIGEPAPMSPDDHLGLAADVFAQISTGPDQAVIAQATAVRYADGPIATSTGYGGFVEAGYRFGMFEPIVGVDRFQADRQTGTTRTVHAGGAVFVDKHRTNFKLDVARVHPGAAPSLWSATLQAQLSF
jgi:hypothetical protein